MKIDKKNARHWWYLLRFGINAMLALLLRPWRARRAVPLVVFYGHKLNGNLSPIYQCLRAPGEPAADAVFLTMDPDYHRELLAAGESSMLASSAACIGLLARCDAVVSSHGLHSMQFLVRLSDIRFFDVWHGIPFKGFDADNFRVQHRYCETWVASELHRQLYLDRYEFPPEIVKVTGYARTDRLVTRHESTAELRRRFGAPPEGKLVLFAPTWVQDSRDRSLYPFGVDEPTFLRALSTLAERLGFTVLVRAHLNSGNAVGRGHPGVVAVPAGQYPDSEGILLISDVLICDWSSIAFDFLLLDRPTIFLDVPAPFRKGLSLGAEYRFGPVVAGFDEMLAALERSITDPGAYWSQFGPAHQDCKRRIYDDNADGRAAERCARRVLESLGH